MTTVRTIVMALVVATLLSQPALGADEDVRGSGGTEAGLPAYACDGGDVTPDGRGGFRCAPHRRLGPNDRAGVHDNHAAQRTDQDDDSAISRSWHDRRGFFRLDPYDTGYGDPLCNPNLRDSSPSDCPWRQ